MVDPKVASRADAATSAAAVQAEFERKIRSRTETYGDAPSAAPGLGSPGMGISNDEANAFGQSRRSADGNGGTPGSASGQGRYRGAAQSQSGTERAETARSVKADAQSTVTALKEQATEAAIEAKGTVIHLAQEARGRVLELVDQQKSLGADKLRGVARAVQAAAGDLDTSSPEMAKLVRTAAAGVDRLADDIKSRNLDDIITSMQDFGRRQPVAFFGGAVLAGFLLARFFKTDAPTSVPSASYPPPSIL